jgi:hypothetical protein
MLLWPGPRRHGTRIIFIRAAAAALHSIENYGRSGRGRDVTGPELFSSGPRPERSTAATITVARSRRVPHAAPNGHVGRWLVFEQTLASGEAGRRRR